MWDFFEVRYISVKQAAVSFKNVRNSEDYGFFDGKEKDRDKSVIFASVATLGRPEYLNEAYFPADYFDYVIIDEFHHAVTDQYRRIVEYFQPQFLLGLTATPERMDGKNIYEICDYNVPYQISLKEAINKGIQEKLRMEGFIRKLTNNQMDNLKKISQLPGAATFSVPGAGKTTEALAYFFVNRNQQDRLLVVAPKNAFGAWDEQLDSETN